MRPSIIVGILILTGSIANPAAAIETTVDLEYQGHFYGNGSDGDPRTRQGVYAAIDIGHRTGDLSFKARASARQNPEADYGIYDDRLYVEELKVVYSTEKIEIGAGRQHIRNGRATLVNPTDYFDQRDYRDALLATDRALATDGVRLTYRIGGFDAEAVYAPISRTSLMPHVKSRWFFALPDAIDLGDGNSIPVTYRWEQYDGSRNTPDRPQVMLRLNRDAELLSYSVSYFRGRDNMPTFDEGLPIVGPSEVIVPIVQSYPDKRSFGFDAEILIDKLVMRAELARVDLDFRDGRQDRYDHAVVGFDINMDSGVFGKQTYLAFEYSKQLSRDGVRYEKEDLRHIFSDAILARAEIELGSTDSVSGNIVYDTRNRQSAAMIEWKREFSDRLSVTTSLDLLSGRPDTFFGQYSRNDRIGIMMEYVF